MSNDKGEILENNAKKCPHCGSTSTIPYKYGLILDEVHQENAKEEKYVWGGCVIRRGAYRSRMSFIKSSMEDPLQQIGRAHV